MSEYFFIKTTVKQEKMKKWHWKKDCSGAQRGISKELHDTSFLILPKNGNA